LSQYHALKSLVSSGAIDQAIQYLSQGNNDDDDDDEDDDGNK
jgi:hypothetical protein